MNPIDEVEELISRNVALDSALTVARSHLRNALREVDDVKEWNKILTGRLLRREEQIDNIKSALGEDALPPHPRTVQFKNSMEDNK